MIAAIAASLGGAGLASRLGWKRVYLGGLAASLASMALLIASRSVETNQGVAYPVLLAATACLGLGFGLTVPVLNTFTAEFHPGAVDRSVLALNALLGLGGIAAFGVGPLRTAGFTLPEIYGASTVVAVLLGLLAMAVARRRPSPATLHPRPASHLK